jgi:hypothetical protein
MNSSIQLILALEQVHNLMSLFEGNESEKFLHSHLFPLQYEIQRQLTNQQFQSKINK